MSTSLQKGVVPTLLSPSCAKHIEWLEASLGAEVKGIWRKEDDPDKRVQHAHLIINGGSVYLCDLAVYEERAKRYSPEKAKDKGVLFQLNIENETEGDRLWKSALDNGAKVKDVFQVQFWGDKFGIFEDPFGYEWSLCVVIHQQK